MPATSFGERRQAVRVRNRVVRQMRTALSARPLGADISDISLTIPQHEFELLEWILQHTKVWDPETAQYRRGNFCWTHPHIPRMHILIKNCPVFPAAPEPKSESVRG